jgi:hypothetical protein
MLLCENEVVRKTPQYTHKKGRHLTAFFMRAND